MKQIKVVCNSGPLIVFSKLNILPIFKELYGKILITDAVYKETVIQGIRNAYTDALNIKLFWEQQKWEISFSCCKI